MEVPYKKQVHTYDVYSQEIWDYVLQQLQNPLLAPYMNYDAMHMYRYMGDQFIRFIKGPHTAQHMWDLQVQKVCYTSVNKFLTQFSRINSHIKQNLLCYACTRTRRNSHPSERRRDILGSCLCVILIAQ